jgi:hypothetical protein
VPTRDRAEARRALRANPELDVETTQIGRDFVAFYQPDRFDSVRAEPEQWGVEYAQLLPKGLRRDRMLALPEVGQDLRERSFGELEREPGAILLSTVRRKRGRRVPRLMLVHVTPNREERLLARPAVVRSIVSQREASPVPGAVVVRPGAVKLEKGLPLYEDETVEKALLVRGDAALRLGDGLLELEPFFTHVRATGCAVLAVLFRD